MWRHSYVVSACITTLSYVTLSCPILSCHVRYFTNSRKITVKELAADCQLSYRKFYGYFFLHGSRQKVLKALNFVKMAEKQGGKPIYFIIMSLRCFSGLSDRQSKKDMV